MAYNTQPLLTDKTGKPIPQIYDPTRDEYIPLTTDVYSEVMIKNLPELQNVSDELAHAGLTSVIKRLDDNTNKVISLQQLQTELVKTLSVNVENFPAIQTVDGTVNVGNLPDKQSVNDDAVLAKLKDLEAKIQVTNDKLTGTINTQPTGSNVVEIPFPANMEVSAGSSYTLGTIDVSSAEYFSFALRGTSSHDFKVTCQRQTKDGLYLDNGVPDRLTVFDISNKRVAISDRFVITAPKMMFIVSNLGLENEKYNAYLYKIGNKVG